MYRNLTPVDHNVHSGVYIQDRLTGYTARSLRLGPSLVHLQSSSAPSAATETPPPPPPSSCHRRPSASYRRPSARLSAVHSVARLIWRSAMLVPRGQESSGVSPRGGCDVAPRQSSDRSPAAVRASIVPSCISPAYRALQGRMIGRRVCRPSERRRRAAASSGQV